MSRPRRYRVLLDVRGRWALEAECLQDCEYRRHDTAWGHVDCGHWTLLPHRFDTRAAALRQAARWRRAQRRIVGHEGRRWWGSAA